MKGLMEKLKREKKPNTDGLYVERCLKPQPASEEEIIDRLPEKEKEDEKD